MYKFFVATKKEFFLLLNDKGGLSLMFLMPLLLVFIITIIQDSTLRVLNENKISLLLVNQDQGEIGQQLKNKITDSGLFLLNEKPLLEASKIKPYLLEEDLQVALHLPQNFSKILSAKANFLGGILLEELDLEEIDSSLLQGDKQPHFSFYYDPVLPENYSQSIANMLQSFLMGIEGDLMITELCAKLELEQAPQRLQAAMQQYKLDVQPVPALLNNKNMRPNSTQHNVPAWTLFSMFFMVMSLGNNIIKERLNGSFVRLKTIPHSFLLALFSKVFVYLLVALVQVLLIFSTALATFSHIGLPPLLLPDNLFALFLVVFFSGLSAVSYAMLSNQCLCRSTRKKRIGTIILCNN